MVSMNKAKAISQGNSLGYDLYATSEDGSVAILQFSKEDFGEVYSVSDKVRVDNALFVLSCQYKEKLWKRLYVSNESNILLENPVQLQLEVSFIVSVQET